jgi:hypothetical protein
MKPTLCCGRRASTPTHKYFKQELPISAESRIRKKPTPIETIITLVNLADFSRVPWVSKATISSNIGAGYISLAKLAQAEPGQLYSDFVVYGKSIGKNPKLGNEIENSYRIVKIVLQVVREG